MRVTKFAITTIPAVPNEDSISSCQIESVRLIEDNKNAIDFGKSLF